MIINGKFDNGLVMTKKEIQGKKDPSKTYFSLGVIADNELGEIGCTEDVYNFCEVGKTYDFATAFRSEYQQFLLTGVTNVHKGSLFPATGAETVVDKK